jgi:hypothetical protein
MAKTRTSKTGKGRIEQLRPEGSSREASLQRVMAQIEKQYGQGAIMQMDDHKYAKVEGIPTGSLSLDIALGGAGIPRGRVTELFGPESSGKTVLPHLLMPNMPLIRRGRRGLALTSAVCWSASLIRASRRLISQRC